MLSKIHPIRFLLAVVCLSIIQLFYIQLFYVQIASAESDIDSEPTRAKLIYSLNFGTDGAEVLRFGDLSGDQQPDILLVQSVRQRITLLKAMTIEGVVLWQVGRARLANARVSSDLAVQIFDINQDGKNEVIVVYRGRLEIREGATGRVIKRRKIPKRLRDAICVVNGQSNVVAPSILVKDRYKQVVSYTRDLRFRKKITGKVGHFPKVQDFNGDGIDELFIGYSLYSTNLNKLWEKDFTKHNDASDVGDMNGDGISEIALSSSTKSYLISAAGRILWSKPHVHSQHAVMGSFVWDRPEELQAVFLDRGNNGNIHFYDYQGNEVALVNDFGPRTIITTVEGWTGRPHENLLLAYRRPFLPPVLLNGNGEQVVIFPEVPGMKPTDLGVPRHFAQHFDLFGDKREEILVYNRYGLHVFENPEEADFAPEITDALSKNVESAAAIPRIYNASFYVTS